MHDFVHVHSVYWNTSIINIYKRYGAILFKGAVQLELFPETKIKPFQYIVPQCGTNRVNMVSAFWNSGVWYYNLSNETIMFTCRYDSDIDKLYYTQYLLHLRTEKYNQTSELILLHLIALKKQIIKLYFKICACHFAMISEGIKNWTLCACGNLKC